MGFSRSPDEVLRTKIKKGSHMNTETEQTKPGANEALYEAARGVVLSSRLASVAVLQRRLRLNYAVASGLMNQLEERGIVGPVNGASPREVLASRDTGQEMSEQDVLAVKVLLSGIRAGIIKIVSISNADLIAHPSYAPRPNMVEAVNLRHYHTDTGHMLTFSTDPESLELQYGDIIGVMAPDGTRFDYRSKGWYEGEKIFAPRDSDQWRELAHRLHAAPQGSLPDTPAGCASPVPLPTGQPSHRQSKSRC